MSHFTVFVLLPWGTTAENVEARLTKVLAPYDENWEAPGYRVRCSCVGDTARVRAREFADKTAGTMDELRKSFHKAHPMSKGKECDWDLTREESYARDQLWEAHIALYVAAETAVRENDLDRDTPQVDCEDCKGTGLRVSTYNPTSKWDWWVIGGRWDGYVRGEEKPKEAKSFSSNVIPASELLAHLEAGEDRYPFALVDLAGTWHEEGQMGWFGQTADMAPPGQWNAQVKELLRLEASSVVVGLDCHI